MNTSLKTWLKKAIVFLVVAAMAIALLPFTGLKMVTKAASGEEPAHDKILTVNEDGTYTIALNVTGDAEKQIQKVNVIVIVDTSGSMGESSGTGAYRATNSTGTNLYGLIDGDYVLLERRSSGGWNPQITFWYNGTQYTGQRYYYDATATRLQATQQAVNGLASTLLGYNGKDGNPNDTVEMALVSFSTNANTDIEKTTSSTTYIDEVNDLDDGGGTNWEAALQKANAVNFGDSDPTYVIFFSDGAPTFHATDGGYDNWNQRYQVYGTGGESEPNMEYSYTQARDDAKSLAEKVGVKNFYTIFAYGTDEGKDYMTQLTSYAGAPEANNYSASDSAELNAAFAEILEAIEMAGIGAVSMEDGTTSSVETTTGEISHLLTVDENSYKYYRAGGQNDDGTGEKYDSTENDGLGEEWTDAPEAKFEEGAVKWDLKSEGVLENDVTYTVTFDCWPSQETLDIVADIKNDPSAYDKLDANIKKYIDSTGNLKTNTTASLSYTDTRTGESSSKEYDNPDPVATSAVEALAISKKWENELDGQSAAPITLTVTRDGKDKYTVELSDDNNWADKVFVSIGIIRGSGSSVEILEKGHDFTFTEPVDLGYYWELEVPTVRPMLINNTVTMLILKGDAPYNNPDGTTEYTIDGKTYYVGGTGDVSLTATNHRRARLNLTKVVDGDDADPTQTFPFTLNVVDSKASEGSEDDLNSDYWVWFSVYNGGYVDAVVSGAEKEMKDGEWTGYYYAPSGTGIVVNLKAGDGLRFLNLPTGSTYTFTEGTLPANYAFTSSVLTAGTDTTFSGAQTTTGTIQETNSDYTVTYTNTYALTDIEITKVWKDNSDQDGKRPTAEEFKSYLVLKADGTDVTSANADKLTVTVDSEDSNKYLVKWTGLDRYADGEEITYTVEETAIDGYTTTGSPAADKGTITNTHEPEVVDVTVVKDWEDSDDIGGIRPTSIEVQLTADGDASGDPVTLNEGNEWTYTWENLPKFKDGEEIEYTADETAVPAGYDKTGPDATTDEDGTITVTVTNTYNPTPVSVAPSVQKVITNNPSLYNKGDFTFKIAAVTEGAPMPENTEITNSATYEREDKEGYYKFDEITFTMPGTYEYKITETGEVDGVTNDPDAEKGKTITFEVTDDGTGKLEVTPTTDQAELTFTNVYHADGEVTLKAKKILTGRDWKEGESFTFTLLDQNGNEIDEKPVSANGEISFNTIEYTEEDAGKTYKYTISETTDPLPGGITKSEDITATVTIKDLGTGKLETTVEYTNDDTITNTYTTKTVDAQISVAKTIDGYIEGEDANGKVVDRTFEFTMKGPKIEGQLTTSITTEGGEGTAAFEPITFAFTDMVDADGKRVTKKDFTYEVTETEGSDAGFTYDTKTYNVVVTVEDKLDGTLEVTNITKEGKVDIVNTFVEESAEVTLHVDKVIDDQSGSASDATFNFVLKDSEGNVLQEKSITTKEFKGGVDFDKLVFTESGEYTYTIAETGEAPDGWTYDTKEYPVVIVVSDNFETAVLKSKTTYNEDDTLTSLTITNVYKAAATEAEIKVTKAIDDTSGSAPDTEFTFTLAAEDGTVLDTATVTGAGTASFKAITYEKAGTYNYTITETQGDAEGWTYDTTTYPVVVTVEDKDAKLVATVAYGEEKATELKVTNIYDPEDAEATLQARKVVDDLSKSAPDETFTFQLLDKDGNLVEEVTHENAGYVYFSALSFSKTGIYEYTIQEVKGETPGFTYDTEGRQVEINVTDNSKATLIAEVKYLTDEEEAVITNVYQAAPVSVDPPVQKIFTGEGAEKFYNKGDFTFTIEAVTEGAPMPENTTITNSAKYERKDKKGFYEFGEIEFTAAGTYVYKVTESGSVTNVTNDPETTKTLTFTVTDVDGTLKVSPATDEVQCSFTNTIKEEPKTGDNSNIALLLVIMGLALAAGATSLILLKKSRKEN